MGDSIDIFKPIVAMNRLGKDFQSIATHEAHRSLRTIANRVFNEIGDPDGNFIEQFQTTGTDSRIWELYLTALFRELSFSVTKQKRPDFKLVMEGIEIFVEATVSQPSQGGAKSVDPSTHTKEVREDRRDNEFAIKVGSALYSKLQQKYWKLPEVKDKPFILGIGAFHSDDSFHFTDAALVQYLYGVKAGHFYDVDGNLSITETEIEKHSSKAKTIPSGFFSLPDSEHISGVLFNNSGTLIKFARIGDQEGHGTKDTLVVRCGTCYNADPKASRPQGFIYKVGDLAFPLENWRQGAVLVHNPNAKNPVDPNLFPGLVHYMSGSPEDCWAPAGFIPYESKTFRFVGKNLALTPVKSRLLTEEDAVACMTQLLLASGGAIPFKEMCAKVF